MLRNLFIFLSVFTLLTLMSTGVAHAASCDVYALTIGARNTTSSPIIYSADSKCDTGVKGMRFSVNGTVIYEKENTSHIGYWYKPADTDRLCFEAKGTDGVYSASRCVRGSEKTTVSGGAVLGTSTTPTTTSPSTTRVQNTSCPSTVPPRLSNGKSGHTLTSVNVRAGAGINALRIGRLAPGTTFEVQSDATCSGGINWWKVKIQEFTGMMAESQFGSYLLSP